MGSDRATIAANGAAVENDWSVGSEYWSVFRDGFRAAEKQLQAELTNAKTMEADERDLKEAFQKQDHEATALLVRYREALQEALYRCQEDEAITVPMSFTMLLKKALKSGEDTKG